MFHIQQISKIFRDKGCQSSVWQSLLIDMVTIFAQYYVYAFFYERQRSVHNHFLVSMISTYNIVATNVYGWISYHTDHAMTKAGTFEIQIVFVWIHNNLKIKRYFCCRYIVMYLMFIFWLKYI